MDQTRATGQEGFSLRDRQEQVIYFVSVASVIHNLMVLKPSKLKCDNEYCVKCHTINGITYMYFRKNNKCSSHLKPGFCASDICASGVRYEQMVFAYTELK